MVLEYPKGVEVFAQVWSHNLADNSQNWSTLSRHTHLSDLAIDSAFDEEKARNDAFRQFEPSWERWLALCRSTFRRLSAEQTTGIDWRKADGTKCTQKDHPVWASVPIETEPSKYDLQVVVVLLPTVAPGHGANGRLLKRNEARASSMG